MNKNLLKTKIRNKAIKRYHRLKRLTNRKALIANREIQKGLKGKAKSIRRRIQIFL